MIKINGAACRTPAEDIIWEEQQRELEANAPKGKAPAKGKKKWIKTIFLNKKMFKIKINNFFLIFNFNLFEVHNLG